MNGISHRARRAIGSLPVLATLYVIVAGVAGWLIAAGTANFVDLRVYRAGGQAVLHGASLYAVSWHGMPFTYPPFAAVLFAGPAVLRLPAAAALLTAASVVALPVMLYLALRLRPLRDQLSSAAACRVALAAGAAAIWLEPVSSTLAYGQIDLLLAAAVLYDVSLPASSRWKGLGIGLAAGLKLTPAIFAVYYLLTRRYRAAATSAVTFGVTALLGFAMAPGGSWRYWGGQFVNSSRVGQPEVGANESLAGGLARILHTAHITAAWLPVAAVVAVAGLALAAAAYRRAGNEAAGFSLCAITGLLVSPVSWTHHWVIAVPALLIAATAAAGCWPRRPVSSGLALAAVAALTVAGWIRLARVVGGNHWLHLSAWAIVATDVYVLAALAALAVGLRLALGGGKAAGPDGLARSDTAAGDRPELPDRVSSKG